MNKKPFVKLLSYKNKLFFIYDVNKNIVKPITENTYTILKKMDNLNDENCDHSINNDEISLLISEGYLLGDRPQNIEQPLNKYLPLYLNTRVNGIVLQVTRNCNLKCKYCVYAINGLYNRKHSVNQMSWETAKESIDFLKKHSTDIEHIRISFYGGEPLLNIKLIKQAVLYAEETMPYKHISFAMTSNLTLLNSESAQFLIDHNFKLTVSLDGPQEINDRNRFYAINGESTYSTVINNLKLLSNNIRYYNNNVRINAVIDKSVDQQYIVDFFKSNHLFRNIGIGYSIVNDSSLKIQYSVSSDYIKRIKINRFKSMLCKIINLTDENETYDDLFEKLNKKTMPFSKQKIVHHDGPCIPGVKKLFVDVHGNFLPCEKANEYSDHLRIGDIHSGFDEGKIYRIYNIGAINNDKCLNCWAIKLCSSCAVNIDDGKELSKNLKNNICVSQMDQLEKDLLQIGMIELFQKVYHRRIL